MYNILIGAPQDKELIQQYPYWKKHLSVPVILFIQSVILCHESVVAITLW